MAAAEGERFAYPVLVGDIGGTNARFALLRGRDAPAIDLPKSRTGEQPGPEEAIAAALAAYHGPAPRSALIGVATKLESSVVRLTNAAWTVDAGAIGRAFGLERVTLINDFVPVATALVRLDRPDALVRLGPARPARRGTRVVLGPGTGLGAAALIPVGERFLVQPTEAGHIDFGASEPDEPDVWRGLERVRERHTAEAVLSGPGLVRLYRAHALARRVQPRHLAPSEVVAAGHAGDPVAEAALDHFARLLGRFAGDLALVFGATGGVYLGGGIAPRIERFLVRSEFRAAFERKAPLEHFVREVPTWLITHRDPAIDGLAAIAADPDRFVLQCFDWVA